MKISNSFKKNFNKIKFIDISDTSKILSEIRKKKIVIDKNTCSIFYESILSKNNKIMPLKPIRTPRDFR